MFCETRKWTSSQCSCCPDERNKGMQHNHHWKGGLRFIQHPLFHKWWCRVLYNDANINTQNSVICMHRPSAETETFTDTCRQKYRAKMTHTHKKGKYTQTQTTHTHADAHGRELQVQNAPTLCQPPQVPEKE